MAAKKLKSNRGFNFCRRFSIAGLLLFSVIILQAQSTERKRNPYNLKIVATKVEYKNQVAKNAQMEMVDLEKLIPGIVLDIRYATKNNFTGEIIYKEPKAFLRKPVAEALKKVQDSLAFHRFGLKIYDAYRPYAATLRFYEVYSDTNFVANPKYGSRHNRGCAVDLTLVSLSGGDEIHMPTVFDDFSEKSHPQYANLPDDVIKNRRFLFSILTHFGFSYYYSEWWHFDYKDWEKYPLMDLSFDELEK